MTAEQEVYDKLKSRIEEFGKSIRKDDPLLAKIEQMGLLLYLHYEHGRPLPDGIQAIGNDTFLIKDE